MCKFSEHAWAFESSFSSFCHHPKFWGSWSAEFMQSSTTISYLGSNSLSSSLGKTCAQLHEHFVAAHMKYACNFEFAIHLNVFLITFYASEPSQGHSRISWAKCHTTTQKQDLQRLTSNFMKHFHCLSVYVFLCAKVVVKF